VNIRGREGAGTRLETTRLLLRPFLPDDEEVLHAFFTHPDVRRFLWDDRVVGRETVGELIQASLTSFSVRGFGQWVAEEARTHALVGFCGLRPVDDLGEIEILYGLVRERWGRGLATEAGHAVLDHAFLGAGLPRVIGRTDSPNLASARVLERLGMGFEGERIVHGRPTLHYALSRDAFRGRRATRSRPGAKPRSHRRKPPATAALPILPEAVPDRGARSSSTRRRVHSRAEHSRRSVRSQSHASRRRRARRDSCGR